MNFIYSLQSEWLKTKRSAASWLTFAGGFFIPVIILIDQLFNYKNLPASYAAPHFWDRHFSRSWQFMAYLLLPIGVILASSLITQLEFKNNTWKQLLTTPQKLTTIFFAKLFVIVIMMLQFFILFNIGTWLSAVIPSWIIKSVPYPAGTLPVGGFLKIIGLFFVDCLPIIALQYLLSLQFKNFLVPVGVGLAIFMAAIIANGWQYVYIIPYSYCMLTFMRMQGRFPATVPVHLIAICYSLAFTIVSYVLFIRKKEKG